MLGAAVSYGAGGCALDVNQDGLTDLVLLEEGSGGHLGVMVWLEAPSWRRHLIDTGAAFRDCLPAVIHGRRGVLVTHRQMQVRFYEAAGKGRWPYREIYSIYTPSAQGGLLVSDVDGDSLPDILCGNYWIQSPRKFEESWRLFAIHNWWEEPRSAMVRIALGAHYIAAESEEAPARLSWFEKPADPKELWVEHPLQLEPPLKKPQALLATENGFLVGEDEGSGSRLIRFDRQGGSYRPAIVATSSGFRGLWQGSGRIFAATGDAILMFRGSAP